MTAPATRATDKKGRPYLPLGKFMGRYALQVYVTKAAKGERREDGARVVLAGYEPELRAAVPPHQAERLDRRRALLRLWDQLVQLVDDKVATPEAADAYLAAMAAEGIEPPPGPLHQPGVPRRVRVTPSPNPEPGLVREFSCLDRGWKGFSDEEATQCRADRGPASAG